MRVKVHVTLDVDENAWAEEYGVHPTEVRADVVRWARERLNRYDDGIARVVTPGEEED